MEDAPVTSENTNTTGSVEASEPQRRQAVEQRLIDQLVDRAQAEGLQLTGEGGLLGQLTKRLLESALEGEMTDHLGYDKHERLLGDVGPVVQRRGAPRGDDLPPSHD